MLSWSRASRSSPARGLVDDLVQVDALDGCRRHPGEIEPVEHGQGHRLDVQARHDVADQRVEIEPVEDDADDALGVDLAHRRIDRPG